MMDLYDAIALLLRQTVGAPKAREAVNALVDALREVTKERDDLKKRLSESLG